MADPSTCRWCETSELFGPVHLHVLTTGSLSGDVHAATLPQSGVVRQQTTVPVGVWVCRSCGHLENVAATPEVLYERFQAGER